MVLFSSNRSARATTPPDVPVHVRLEIVGRERSGKTAQKACFFRGPLQGAYVSGLELTAVDPTVMTRWTQDALEIYRHLWDKSIPSTQEPSVTEYSLFQADRQLGVLQFREVVGQVLTHTMPDSPDAQRKLYTEYIENLSKANVIQVMMPCPSSNDPIDLARFEADLQTHTAYLREALKVRNSKHPCAVVVALNKIDVAFETEQEARERLNDETLRQMLGRVIRLVEGSEKVALGAIFPFTAFGFGNAVSVEPEPAERQQTQRAAGMSVLSHGETEWLLKPNTVPIPYNLTAMVWWTLMAGILLKPADARQAQLAELAKMLNDDLQAMNAWFVPLNCRTRA